MIFNAPKNWWKGQNIILPHGCPLRFIHHGIPVAHGNVKNGKLCADGIFGANGISGFDAPSPAISRVVAERIGRHISLNGWRYIEIPLLGRGWVSLHELRALVGGCWAYCVPKINYRAY